MVLNKRQLIGFLILTFSLTFFFIGIIVIANRFGYLAFDTPFGMLLYIIGTLSPTIASFACLKKSGLISSLKEFIKTAFAIRQKTIHYVLVLIFIAVEYFFPAFLLKTNSDVTWYMVFLMFIPCIADGGLEELGWRYVLQPTLEKRLSFFIASSITAFIWALWHLPYFFVSGTGQSEMPIGLFIIMTFGVSFALAAIYHISKSVWLCIMFHALFNALSFYWPIAQEFSVTLISSICLIMLSVVLVFLYDKERGKQDYHVSSST